MAGRSEVLHYTRGQSQRQTPTSTYVDGLDVQTRQPGTARQGLRARRSALFALCPGVVVAPEQLVELAAQAIHIARDVEARALRPGVEVSTTNLL